MAVVVLVATVHVRGGDAYGVAVHAQGRAVGGRQESRRGRLFRRFAGVHLLYLKQW